MTANTLAAQVVTSWGSTTASLWSNTPCAPSAAPIDRSALRASESLAGRASVAVVRNLWVDASSSAGFGSSTCDGSEWSGSATARAAYQSPGWRVWLAYTDLHAPSDTIVRLTGFSAGVQRRLGAAVLGVSVGPRRDRSSRERVLEPRRVLNPEVVWSPNGEPVVQETTYVADTVTRVGTARVPDLSLSLSFRHRALSLDATGHFALAGDIQRSDPFAQLQVAYDLAPRVSAVAGLSSRGSVPSLDMPAGVAATLGFRIRGARTLPNASRRVVASEFRVTADSDGRIAISVRAAGAKRVEIAGDFTHWEAVPLEPADDGWWRASIRTNRGPHRVSVRVNGGPWIAPPGLPPVQDEFGATVGLLLAP